MPERPRKARSPPEGAIGTPASTAPSRRGDARQRLVPLMDIGRWRPPIPCLPDAAEPPPCKTVVPTPGVPAVRFRLNFTVEPAVPADASALGLPPEPVPALGLPDP